VGAIQAALRIIVTIIFIIVGGKLSGQAVYKPKSSIAYNWNAKFYVGKTQYYGDVSHDDKMEKLRSEAKLSIGASLTKEINPILGITADFFYTKLFSKKGNNNQPFPTVYELYGTYYDFTISPRVDLVNVIADSRLDVRFSAYITLGLGYGIWNTTVENITTGEIVGGQTNKYVGGLVIPTTVALDYRLTSWFSIFVDGQIRIIVNDRLDNWEDGWQTDQLFVANIGISFDFDFKYHVKPSDINRSRISEEYMKKVNRGVRY